MQVFPGSVRAGNITVTSYSVTYNFLVSAGVMVGPLVNEGDLSAATIKATLFIPDPGI